VTLTTIEQDPPAAMAPPVRLTELAPAVAVGVPPHVLLRFTGLATANPPGSESANAIPLNPTVAFRLVSVKVRVVAPFSGMLEAPKFLLMVGGPTTVNIAVLLLAPVPPSVEVIAPVVLALTPRIVPVTLIATVQEAPGVSEAPDKLMAPPPELAEGVPEQVLLNPLGLATTTPDGKESEKAMLFSVTTELGLLMLKVRLVLPPTGMSEAPKALLMVAGSPTFTVAEAVLPVPPLVELTAPLVLFFCPSVVPVTFTTTVQEELTGIDPPLKEMELVPAVAVTVPLQV